VQVYHVTVVADTEDIYTKISGIIASQYGKQFTWELKAKLMGKKLEEAAPVFAGINYLSHLSSFSFNFIHMHLVK